MSLIDKHKHYFESWLNLSEKEIISHEGIHISVNTGRHNKPEGSLLYFPMSGFETKNSLFISCIPEWEDEIKFLTKNASIPDAIERLNQFVEGKPTLLFKHHAFWGLKELNPNISFENVVFLDKSHMDAYIDFYRKTNAGLSSLVDPSVWMDESFNELVESKTIFCVFENNEIVCATTSDSLPYNPMGLIQIGINTLDANRRKGYATQACAAFINYHLKNEKLPVWKCKTENVASNMLAKKLGFNHFGNEFFISSICSMND